MPCRHGSLQERGLGAGNFQEQLETVLAKTPIFLPLLTPPPSGADSLRKNLTSLQTLKVRHQRRGRSRGGGRERRQDDEEERRRCMA